MIGDPFCDAALSGEILFGFRLVWLCASDVPEVGDTPPGTVLANPPPHVPAPAAGQRPNGRVALMGRPPPTPSGDEPPFRRGAAFCIG